MNENRHSIKVTEEVWIELQENYIDAGHPSIDAALREVLGLPERHVKQGRPFKKA
jgi:hypothetical protein